jgi:gentisate 1,2-dioxygenase
MATAERDVDPKAVEALKGKMEAQSLAPLWEIYSQLVTKEPNAAPPAHHWSWGEMESAVRLTGETVHGHDADHRVLLLKNPNYPGRMTTTNTIIGAVQYVLPGEQTTPHRHTPSAVRLVLEGSGGATFVDGQRCDMHSGDFIVTPNWTWHGHHNDSAGDAIWVDILDVPFVKSMDAVFGQPGPTNDYPETVATLPDQAVAQGGLLPVTDRPAVNYTSRFRYAWTDVVEALAAMGADADGSKTLRYADPRTGAPVTPTLDAYMMEIAKGTETRPRRTSATSLCVVVEGSGSSTIGETTVAWGPKDIFTLPEWTWAAHKASGGPARILRVTDQEVLRALGLLREERG